MIKFDKNTQNYFIIAILSAILVFFIPMCGSVAGLGWRFPDTVGGWVVYVTTKLAVCGINLLIFHHFVKQAKINIAENPNYIEAVKMLMLLEPETAPRAPKDFFAKQYLSKGASLVITTLLSTVCITQAILTFDYISMITHVITVVFGIIFGIMVMREDEEYWTNEFLFYAKKRNKEILNDDTTNTRP